ncbi:MAG: T9SS type A sorting domain-containing protein, partial [Bacteroidia bacterium]
MTDMYFAKLSPTGNLLYATLIGGSDLDAINRMKIYNNELYILGTTTSTNFPMLGASNYSSIPGFQNLVIIRLNSSGQPNFSTYFGSVGGYDAGQDLAVKHNSIFFCGKSSSATYPISASAYQAVYGTNDDGILTKLPNNNASIVTAIKETQINSQQFILFPNPVSEKINIKNFASKENKIEILNLCGQLIREEKIDSSEINIKDLEEGIYFLRINNSAYKFVKEN